MCCVGVVVKGSSVQCVTGSEGSRKWQWWRRRKVLRKSAFDKSDCIKGGKEGASHLATHQWRTSVCPVLDPCACSESIECAMGKGDGCGTKEW